MKARDIFLFFCIFFCLTTSFAAERLDKSFGSGGIQLTAVNHYGDQAYAVAVQEDGKIIVAGSSHNGSDLDFALVRYNRDGSLDKSFNYDGTVTVPVGHGDDEALAVALLPDGRIVAAGYTDSGRDRDIALVRFNPDGSLDSDFGLDGVVVTPVGNSDDEATAILVNEDGSLYVAGTAAGTVGHAVVLVSYLEDGNLDPAFGEQGMALAGVGQDSLVQGIAVQENGRIVLSGSYSEGEDLGLMLVAFDEGGIIDSSFGYDGVAVNTGTVHPVSEGYTMTTLEDGSFLVAGSVGLEGRRDAALFLFDRDGRPVDEFGDQGVLVIGASEGDDVFYGVAANGEEIVASGYADTDAGKDFLYFSRTLAEMQTWGRDVPAVRQVTRLHFNDLKVVDSFAEYNTEEQDKADSGIPGVSITPLSTGDDVSYGVVLDQTGRGIAVGMSDDGKASSFAVAGYTKAGTEAAKAASLGGGSSYAATLNISEVTRTGAFIACETYGSGITERGVVFSIAPNPVLGEGNSSDNGNNPVIAGPTVTNTTPATFSGSSITLSVTTDVNANCRYKEGSDADYSAMTKFSSTGSTQHTQELTGLSSGTYIYYVRCRDVVSQAVNTTGTRITFSSSDSSITPPPAPKQLALSAARTVGEFLVPSAMAADATTTASTGLFSTESREYQDSGSVQVGAGSGPYTGILKDLKPGTFYYVRAYAKVGDTVYYGNQLGFKTADACFVATAAYGSIFHPFVRVLRNFRDRFLLGHPGGEQFVQWYYRVSPPLAEMISQAALLRFLTCILLLPLVALAWSMTHLGVIGTLFLLAGLAAGGRMVRKRPAV